VLALRAKTRLESVPFHAHSRANDKPRPTSNQSRRSRLWSSSLAFSLSLLQHKKLNFVQTFAVVTRKKCLSPSSGLVKIQKIQKSKCADASPRPWSFVSDRAVLSYCFADCFFHSFRSVVVSFQGSFWTHFWRQFLPSYYKCF
jgi:hypothetical protein